MQKSMMLPPMSTPVDKAFIEDESTMVDFTKLYVENMVSWRVGVPRSYLSSSRPSEQEAKVLSTVSKKKVNTCTELSVSLWLDLDSTCWPPSLLDMICSALAWHTDLTCVIQLGDTYVRSAWTHLRLSWKCLEKTWCLEARKECL